MACLQKCATLVLLVAQLLGCSEAEFNGTEWSDADEGAQGVQSDAAEYALRLRREQMQVAGYSQADYDKFRATMVNLERLAEFDFNGKITGADPPELLPEDAGADELGSGGVSWFEGDIVLSLPQMDQILASAEETVLSKIQRHKRVKRKLTSNTFLRWPTAINFRIDTASRVDQAAVLAGVRLWQSLTCLRFNRITTPAGDYMEFFAGAGCYSNVGRVGGKQTVSIGRGCEKLGIVAHEIGHALGMWHEQSRADRDQHVRIVQRRVQGGRLSNFLKRAAADLVTFAIPYDLGSVMHYGPTAFSITRDYTIETLDSNKQNTIGQREGLSFYDVKFINQAYCSDTCPRQLPCQHNGYTDPLDCSRCRCPDGLAGPRCTQPLEGARCGTQTLSAAANWATLRGGGAGKCAYLIQAPPGGRVIVEITDFSYGTFFDPVTCTTNYLEVKNDADLGNTGGRMCGRNRPTQSFASASDKMLLIEAGGGGRFSVRYRAQGGSRPVVTTPPTTTTTTTTTEEPIGPSKAPMSTSTTTAGPGPGPSGPQWGQWGGWTRCSASCGGCGVTSRHRSCLNKRCNSADAVQFRRCNFDRCPVQMCRFCPNGEKWWCPNMQQRPCGNQKVCCAPFSDDGRKCALEVTTPRPVATTSAPKATTTTERPSPPGVGYGPWSGWTPCQGSTCGGCGRRFRARTCQSQPCVGVRVQVDPCNFATCVGSSEKCCSPYKPLGNTCVPAARDAPADSDKHLDSDKLHAQRYFYAPHGIGMEAGNLEPF